jgi:outer membrane protein assembly factor BamD (BamD/ComL family)
VYYGDVILKDPNSPYAPEARLRIEALNRLVVPPTAAQ